MKITEFLTKQNCPVCSKQLTPFMQWVDSMCFKGKYQDDNSIKFETYLGADKGIQNEELQDGAVTIYPDMKIEFSTPTLLREAQRYQAYFLFVCNEDGFRKQSFGEYEILPYYACYARTTPNLEFKDSGRGLFLESVNPDSREVMVKNEVFCLTTTEGTTEKVYIANLETEEKRTEFWYYTVSEEEKNTAYHRPNTLHKVMPLISSGFHLSEGKAKMIDRFNTWILMS